MYVKLVIAKLNFDAMLYVENNYTIIVSKLKNSFVEDFCEEVNLKGNTCQIWNFKRCIVIRKIAK